MGVIAALAITILSRPVVPVPPVGDPSAARLHADGCAAVHGPRMALHRRHRGWTPPDPAAGHLQDIGKSLRAGRHGTGGV